MILAVSLVTLLFASDASCQTLVTYSSRSSEELLCPITEETRAATWSDETNVTTDLASYFRGESDIEIVEPGAKHGNFIYYVNGTSFSMFIQDVQAEDGGDYECNTVGGGTTRNQYTVVVEVVPETFSLDCFVPPDVTCPELGVNPTSELVCVCAASGVRPGTLYLDIPDAHTPQQNESSENGDLFDLRLTATVPVTESTAEVTCSVKGYITMEQIPSKLITTNFNTISPPTCSLDISFDHECKVAMLTCSCSASPTDGESPSDSGMVFSYFNEAGDLIVGNATNTVQIGDVEAGVNLTYSCRGCNGLYYGENSYVTNSSECTISTTTLPTTTITTVPLSTKEPTSTKAMVTTTEEPKDDNPKNPGSSALGAGGIAGIIVGVVAVIIVIVVIAVIVLRPGEDDSKPSDSSVADGNVTATNINITSSEPPAPVYGVVKKDSKKKSDKPDNNGAPTYGTNDKNITNDQAPAPHSSMRDSTNSSKPKQDMEMQYADIDHGNKPPSDEVRKPNKEPTEYATVQPVIV